MFETTLPLKSILSVFTVRTLVLGPPIGLVYSAGGASGGASGSASGSGASGTSGTGGVSGTGSTSGTGAPGVTGGTTGSVGTTSPTTSTNDASAPSTGNLNAPSGSFDSNLAVCPTGTYRQAGTNRCIPVSVVPEPSGADTVKEH